MPSPVPPVRLEVSPRGALRAGGEAMLIWKLTRTGTDETPLDVEVEVLSNKATLRGDVDRQITLTHVESPEYRVTFFQNQPGLCELEFFVHVNSDWCGRAAVLFDVPEPNSGGITHVYNQTASDNAQIIGNNSFGTASKPAASALLRVEEFTSIPLNEPHFERPVPADGLLITLPDRAELIVLPVRDKLAAIGRGRWTKGRPERKIDMVLRGIDNASSECISRHHADLEFTERSVYWIQRQASYGTTIDGQSLPTGERHRIESRHCFDVAGVLSLTAELFDSHDSTDWEPAWRRHCQRLGSDWAGSPRGVSSLAFSVSGGPQDGFRYVFMHQSLRLGNHRRCPIKIDGDGVEPFHAQIVYLAETFWIEPCQQNAAVVCGGNTVPFGSRLELKSNSVITLGNVRCTVEVMRPAKNDSAE